MNKIESFVYNIVKSNPYLKFAIRNIYQSFMDLLPREKNFSINQIHSRKNFFYGFHDTTPFSSCDGFLLANKTNIQNKMPEKEDLLEIGYFSLNKSKMLTFFSLAKSNAWNFHKGCRLQWIKNNIIFNDFQHGNYCSKIINKSGKVIDFFPFPIDSVSKCGNFATSFSYERLEKMMPGYGYIFKEKYSYVNKKITSKTGLFIYNLQTKKIKYFISLESLCLNIDQKFKSYYHYVTHTSFSENGKYISFMHRWTDPNKTLKRWSILKVLNTENNEIITLPTDLMVSHYVWNKNKILAYCRIDNKDSHVIFDIENDLDFKRVFPNILNSDGHQTIINENCFITDTYPNSKRMQKLYHCDFNKKVTLIASLYHPKKFLSTENNHVCVDLHPRASNNGKMVCFDSAFSGTRSICTMEL